VRVSHHRANVLLVKKLRDGAHVATVLKQMRGEGMSERVACGALRQDRLPHGLGDCLLQ
jgi:hypothetical protein